MEREECREISREFFEKLSVQIDDIQVRQEEDHIFSIDLKTPDSGILIGFSGKTLEDIRGVLKSLLSHRFDVRGLILHLEINDYLSQKDQKLFDFIAKKIEQVKQGKWDIVLPFFNAYERKKIHSYISDLGDSGISASSIGEWKERKIHLSKKSKNISIDMDGIGI